MNVRFALLLVTLPLSAVAAPRGDDVRLPATNVLVAALRHNDDVELERLGTRLGPDRLTALLDEPVGAGREDDRDVRRAIWRALSLIDDGWTVLPELAERLPRETLAPADAAHAVRQVAEGLPSRLWGREVPTDLARRSTRMLAQALNAVSLPAARVDVVYALSALGRVAPVDGVTLGRLLDDEHEDATVRRAAAEALATEGAPALSGDAQHRTEAALLTAVDHAAAPNVAAAAAAVLCRASWHTPRTATQQARIRQLATDGDEEIVDRLDLLGCLRPNDPLDRKVLDDLAAHGPEALRRRARAQGGR